MEPRMGKGTVSEGLKAFLAARNFLLAHRGNPVGAARDFAWPKLGEFNWALDYFDSLAGTTTAPALWVVNEGGAEEQFSFAEMAERSAQAANYLRRQGVKRGDRLLLMLGNEPALWDAMLGAFKLGAVVIPASVLLTPEDLADRLARGRVSHVIAGSAHTEKFAGLDGKFTRIAVGEPRAEWLGFGEVYAEATTFTPDGPTRASDPLLLYFTSGTTSKPKLVMHTHETYPVGHLSTMYWI